MRDPHLQASEEIRGRPGLARLPFEARCFLSAGTVVAGQLKQ